MTAAYAKIGTRTAAVRTPGAPPPHDDRGESDPEALARRAPDLDDGAVVQQANADGEQIVTMTAKHAQAMIDRAVAQALAGAAAARTAPGKPEAPLPDQSEIDPTKITRPTLSAQGYVMPANYGEPADPSIKR